VISTYAHVNTQRESRACSSSTLRWSSRAASASRRASRSAATSGGATAPMWARRPGSSSSSMCFSCISSVSGGPVPRGVSTCAQPSSTAPATFGSRASPTHAWSSPPTRSSGSRAPRSVAATSGRTDRWSRARPAAGWDTSSSASSKRPAQTSAPSRPATSWSPPSCGRTAPASSAGKGFTAPASTEADTAPTASTAARARRSVSRRPTGPWSAYPSSPTTR
jgi:hypothetical protein